jgi:hypothetical protein
MRRLLFQGRGREAEVPAVIDAMLKLEAVHALERASELQHYVEKGKQVSQFWRVEALSRDYP